jgi:hypothetical protein
LVDPPVSKQGCSLGAAEAIGVVAIATATAAAANRDVLQFILSRTFVPDPLSSQTL